MAPSGTAAQPTPNLITVVSRKMGKLLGQWKKFPVNLAELCIDTTLRCGQAFRWQNTNNEWRCSLHGRIICLKQDDENLYFKTSRPTIKIEEGAKKGAKKERDAGGAPPDDTEAFLRSYFNLHLDLQSLYNQWAKDDANFRKKAPSFNGIRILNQDPWEALVCFICSSNNNIARISQMSQKLCTHYGTFLGTIDGEDFHDFPEPEALASSNVEARLRELGFGYRAKYIVQTAKTVSSEKPANWLGSLRNPGSSQWPGWETVPENKSTYRDTHEQLLLLSGVGPKVADCVCLMGLGWGEAVPVDTHVWQIAVRDYKFKGKGTKTMSKVMYDNVGDHFRELWGTYAGWAQSVLFTANLRAFADRSPSKPAAAVPEEPVQVSASTPKSREKRKFKEEEEEEEEAKPKRRVRKS